LERSAWEGVLEVLKRWVKRLKFRCTALACPMVNTPFWIDADVVIIGLFKQVTPWLLSRYGYPEGFLPYCGVYEDSRGFIHLIPQKYRKVAPPPIHLFIHLITRKEFLRWCWHPCYRKIALEGVCLRDDLKLLT